MKNKALLIPLLAAVVFASCTPAVIPPPSTKRPAPVTHAVPANTGVPPQSPTDRTEIQPYDDVRFQNLAHLHGLGSSLIETLWFNQSTTWSEEDEKSAEKLLRQAMNPGLGVRDLHSLGITGKDVLVAIIDQNMVLDHPQFKGKIIKYYDAGTDMSPDEGSMHGAAVTSLLVGETIGTAPDAKVYYAAAPSWTGDAQYYADALNWIVDENAELPAGGKIRAVSVSAAPSGQGSPFTMNNAAWDAAVERATQAGLLVLDCTQDDGITAPCYYDLDDPDNLATCIPGWPGIEDDWHPVNRIHIPTSPRTTAEEYHEGEISYQFTGRGGLSWSVPYLAGVLAMGWQINPGLTNDQMLEMLFASAYMTKDGLKVIHPQAFIEMVKGTVE